ncbi:MAG: glycosyl transferase group 1 [Phycisphaerales bacterium]|nr:glycosyl transferase group 1 [Phycisphaerales bacterium]
MRITMFVGRADLCGGQRVLHIYAQKLQERGHEVLLIARPPRRPTVRERLRQKLLNKPLPAVARHSDNYFDKSRYPRDYEFRFLPEHRPATAADVPDADVVVATWWETAEWVNLFPASKGTKVYFVQHYETFGGDEARVDATWRLPMHKVCVAQWLVDLARDRFNDLSAELVANAVDLEQFVAPPRGKQPVPTVGVMYSWVPFKGVDISVRAVELARREVPDLKLLSFGAVDPQPSVPLPEGTEYRFQPPQDEIKDYYGRCDAWLFGSRSEGFGLPLLEAMACRTPVIATPAGAAPELVAGGGGIMVPPEDPEAMAAAIVRVARMHQAEWAAMSDRALATAQAHNWDVATDRFEAALTRVATAGRPRLRTAG